MIKFLKTLILTLLLILPVSSQNNWCLSYDGGDYLRALVADWQHTNTAGSISMWLYTNENAATRWALGSADEGGTSRYWHVGTDATENPEYWLRNNLGPNITTASGLNAWTDQEWAHVVYTSSGSATSCWINGVESDYDATINFWLDDVDNRDNVTIGCRQRGATPDGFWLGYIDEVSVFSRDLGSAGVDSIYNSGTPNDVSAMAGLTDYWRFEEGSGTTTAPTVGSITFTFGDGSTSSTYPTWTDASTAGLGWSGGAAAPESTEPVNQWNKWPNKWRKWMVVYIINWSLLWSSIL